MYLIITTSVVAYLLGAIPFGRIIVRIFTGKSITKEGSGNIGATNVLRVSGKKLAFFTLLLDFLKSLVISEILKFNHIHYWYIPGFIAVLGHMFPVYTKFKGGKGVASFMGFVFAINFNLFALISLTWLFIFWVFKYSSLAALIALFLSILYAFMLGVHLIPFLLLVILVVIIIIKHKSNIIRLINKEEAKINYKKN